MIALALLAALTATPATFGVVVAKSHPADVITLAPGFYGDQVLKYGEEHVVGPPTAVFHTLALQPGASGSSLFGFGCRLTPDASTTNTTQCIRLAGTATNPVKNVTISNLSVSCGLAVNGVNPKSPPAKGWPGGNVLGWVTGMGIGGNYLDTVTVSGSEVSNCARGISLNYGSRISILSNNVHDVRNTAIGSAATMDETIRGNALHDLHPWNPANNGNGDHSDFIHILTEAGKPPVSGLLIDSNTIDQGRGVATIGIHLDDNLHNLGFPGLRVTGNTIRDADNQGIRLENAQGIVAGNELINPPGASTIPQIIVCTDPKYCAPSSITFETPGTAVSR